MLLALLLGGCEGDGAAPNGADDGGDQQAAIDLESFATAGELRVRIDESLTELATAKDESSAADPHKRLDEIAADADELAAEARGGTPADAAAAEAASRLGEAAKRLSALAAEMEQVYGAAAAEREPGVEAQDELLALSGRLDELAGRLTQPRAALREATVQARRDLNELTPRLDNSQLDALTTLKVTFARGTEEGELPELQKALQNRAAVLADEVAELKPADVIADCTPGAQTVTDFSVRNMDCDEAEAIVLDAIPVLAPSFSVDGFSCTILGDYGPTDGPVLGATDVRCEAGEQAFRFGFAD